MSLAVNDIHFSYDGRRPVLDGLSFSLEDGTFNVMLGRNGAGKTTLFRIILGILKAQEGSVSVDGVDLAGMGARERARRIAYIPQESHPSFSYSVLTTVLMGTSASISTLASPGVAEMKRAQDALERFSISHLANRRVDSLSGGERQLVLCARALAQDAPLLLFDEPTSKLDWANQVHSLDNIKSLTSDGHTALVAMHDIVQALNWADNIILIKDGHTWAEGSPDKVADSDLLSGFYSTPIKVGRLDGQYICTPRH